MAKKTRSAPVTPAEFQVMDVVWSLGAGTVAAIHAAFPKARKVAYNTVLTQIRLLHDKGYVARESLGRAHIYRAKLDRGQTLERVIQQFADQYFEGSRTALAAAAAQEPTAESAATEP